MLELERHQGGEKALLVHLNLHDLKNQDDLSEFIELVRSAHINDVEVIVGSGKKLNAKTFVGKGKLEEIVAAKNLHGVEVVLFNHPLSPSQERNLEEALQCRVLDRTGLILDIFSQRAFTFEGKLQVEMAQLKHLSTRLVRGWTHLERQKGGIGLRGPGETQLETDRQLLGKRIKYLNNRLDKVSKQRAQNRQSRKKAEVPTVSLVGYTNAGKSTLFNQLVASDIFVADQLFATLDPTLRKLQVDEHLSVILADTVGFIRHLPHDLIAAFKATLLETCEADLLIHVIDCADEEKNDKIQAVREVLEELGADHIPQIAVLNKIDLLEIDPRIDRDEDGIAKKVFLSSKTQLGIPLLLQVLAETLSIKRYEMNITLSPHEGAIKGWLHTESAIKSEDYLDNGQVQLSVSVTEAQMRKVSRQFNINEKRFEHLSNEFKADTVEEWES